MIDMAWGGTVISSSAVDSCISHVRAAVGDSGREQQFIKTVHGFGYRFVADVEERILNSDDRHVPNIPLRPTDSGPVLGNVPPPYLP